MIGVGVGLASCIAPLYIQELSPTRLRGRMVVLNVVMITLGQVRDASTAVFHSIEEAR